ncbi:MAG: hypothetical protein M0P13_11505 [Fibrobacteraceae bacterium]|nr:hypothetical protein [Fibrobacteraceae bacterium]
MILRFFLGLIFLAILASCQSSGSGSSTSPISSSDSAAGLICLEKTTSGLILVCEEYPLMTAEMCAGRAGQTTMVGTAASASIVDACPSDAAGSCELGSTTLTFYSKTQYNAFCGAFSSSSTAE